MTCPRLSFSGGVSLSFFLSKCSLFMEGCSSWTTSTGSLWFASSHFHSMAECSELSTRAPVAPESHVSCSIVFIRATERVPGLLPSRFRARRWKPGANRSTRIHRSSSLSAPAGTLYSPRSHRAFPNQAHLRTSVHKLCHTAFRSHSLFHSSFVLQSLLLLYSRSTFAAASQFCPVFDLFYPWTGKKVEEK